MPIFAARITLVPLVALLLCALLSAQEAPKPVISSHARLMAAQRIYIEHAGGRLPNDVIGDAFRGWGHYIVVHDPAEADIIVSINAPTADSGVQVSGSNGRPVPLASGPVIQIRLIILDARDRVLLWSGTEQPKSSIKGKQREDNEVDASLKLFRRFRNVIEPEPAPDQ
jgi:hypothetical protein